MADLPDLERSEPVRITGGDEAYAVEVGSDNALKVKGNLSVGTQDKSNFVYGTDTENPIGGVYQDTSPSIAAGKSGAVRITENRALHNNLRDSSGNELLGQKAKAGSVPVVISSDQEQIKTSDVYDGGGVNGAITVGTSAVEAKVGGSVLANRKIVVIYHNGANNLYWGLSSGVTTSNGIMVFKQQVCMMTVGPNTHIWLISNNAGQDVRIVEMA